MNGICGIDMGIKLRFVEYAPRWLFAREGCVFNSINGAADMWIQLKYVQRVIDGRSFTLQWHLNDSPFPRKEGMLLIHKHSKFRRIDRYVE